MERKNIVIPGEFAARYGYSRAVRIGKQIHVAGTCAQPPHDTGDAYEQAIASLRIIEKSLTEVGASNSDVVRTVIYITGYKHAEGVITAHGEVFQDIMPASTMVVIAGLLKPNLVVEIEAYAILSN